MALNAPQTNTLLYKIELPLLNNRAYH
jgi:pilus assembly protein CpaB